MSTLFNFICLCVPGEIAVFFTLLIHFTFALSILARNETTFLFVDKKNFGYIIYIYIYFKRENYIFTERDKILLYLPGALKSSLTRNTNKAKKHKNNQKLTKIINKKEKYEKLE